MRYVIAVIVLSVLLSKFISRGESEQRKMEREIYEMNERLRSSIGEPE